eukprot:1145261-Pelagomonas_calceolata.AAC.4
MLPMTTLGAWPLFVAAYTTPPALLSRCVSFSLNDVGRVSPAYMRDAVLKLSALLVETRKFDTSELMS